MTDDRQSRFVMLVQTVLIHDMVHGREAPMGAIKRADLFDTMHCLDDAFYYANVQSVKLQTYNLASLAQQFVALWYGGDPECKRR